MDLRNLSDPHPASDRDLARRPSLLSLSLTSGYDLATYSATQAPQIAYTRHPLAAKPWAGPPLASAHQNMPNGAPPPPAGIASDVGPWVEQQQQQQQAFAVDPMPLRKQHLQAQNRDQAQSRSPDTLPNPLAALPAGPGAPLAGTTGGPGAPNAPLMHVLLTTSTANTSLVGGDDDRGLDDDELIPTAIVIKNIPFAIKKEQLLDVMTKMNLPLPYAFNYHFDNGVFRGLAFANFTSTSETSVVVNNLNGREIGGRKLRVEYKKMLPAQERERIEREKREKRGQLEEQHRSVSNASLTSLISATSTTAATKNLSVAGQPYASQTERVVVHFPAAQPPQPPLDVDLNDPDTLDLYLQLLTFREDSPKLTFELAFPPALALPHKKLLSLLCAFLNLLELFDNGYIIIRRKPGQQTLVQRQQQNSTFTHLQPQQQPLVLDPQPAGPAQQATMALHSLLMMNLNQMPALLYPGGAPELLRSHSQLALAQPRRQASTPVQYPYNGQQPKQQQQQQQQQGKYQGYYPQAGTAVRLATRSFVDVRSPLASYPAEAPQTQQPLFQGLYFGQVSQPGTPLQSEIQSRFTSFLLADDYMQEPLGKLNSLNLNNGFEKGIWGKK